jgi:hypothetical protein
MALSRGNDPLHWQELNGGRPVLASDLGEKGLRASFVARSPTGDRLFLTVTDLSGLPAGAEGGRHTVLHGPPVSARPGPPRCP